jgi:hypothetical protein
MVELRNSQICPIICIHNIFCSNLTVFEIVKMDLVLCRDMNKLNMTDLLVFSTSFEVVMQIIK